MDWQVVRSDSVHKRRQHSQMCDLHEFAVLDLAGKNLEQRGLARAGRAQQQTHAPLQQKALLVHAHI